MLSEALFFSAVLFSIGVIGVLTRRNAIIVFMCVELMLNAVNLSFVAFAQVYGVARVAHAHDEDEGAHGDDHHQVVRHRHAGLVSLVGPGVLVLAFGLALSIFMAMRAVAPHTPFVQTYFAWMPVGDLQINAAF